MFLVVIQPKISNMFFCLRHLPSGMAKQNGSMALLVIFSLAGSTCNRCVLRQELGFPQYWMATCLLGEHHNHIFFVENRFGFLASMWAEKKVRHGPPLSLHWQLHWCVQHWDKFAPAWLWWSTTRNPFAGNHYSLLSWLTFLRWSRRNHGHFILFYFFAPGSYTRTPVPKRRSPSLQYKKHIDRYCSYRPSNLWLLIWSYQGWLAWPTRWYCVNLRVSSVGLAVSNNLVVARVQTHWYCPPYHQFPY